MIQFIKKEKGLRNFFQLFILLFILQAHVFAQGIDPDNTAEAFKSLQAEQETLRQQFKTSASLSLPDIEKMLNLGLFEEANGAIGKLKDPTAPAVKLLKAHYLVLQNNFAGAETFVNEVLIKNPDLEEAVAMKAFLEIQAWRLEKAKEICTKFLSKKKSEKINVLLGRILLLQKEYEKSMAIADKVLKENGQNAEAWRLKADVYFWDQQPEKAEDPLKKSLTIDPLNADARFNYGYAIWRRIDATQLNQMAAQWDLALAINPLHYQTHWHWGNGHTNLTYADYAQKEDDEVRKELTKADDAIRKNQVEEAIAITRLVAKKYPQSILPLMHRGSIYYSAYDMDRKTRLDSAVAIFRSVLARKKHYGPAHNALSAAIKSQRIPYLTMYDSLISSLDNTHITDMENFAKVFPDVVYYPGDQVKAMAWNQLFTAVVYFPFLSKQGNSFAIPPLHIDLSTAMNSSYFRFGTTFDNRQWMDIRGVGSGAAAIEYVERGAFLERNVILHEYVHLFHGRVLTDAQNRKIRSLYYNAMKENRTLDYYSQNNESEYFAQTYPAYFEPVKVHPLDFKSMNTTSDLKKHDPEMYHFLDEMITNEKAYLAGNKQAMASNWAQVYLNLSNRTRGQKKELASSLLDTALQYDSKYLPAYLAYAKLQTENNQFDQAADWLNRATKIDARYAPIYLAYAKLEEAKFDNGLIDRETSLNNQVNFLKKAGELEGDYQELAGINGLLRELYRSNGMIDQSLQTALDYVKNGSKISTYLRDRIDDASAFAAVLTTHMALPRTVETLQNLVKQKPQNYEYRNYYADVLTANHEYRKAIQTIEEAQAILTASGNARPDYTFRIAENYFLLNNTDSAYYFMDQLLSGKLKFPERERLRYGRLLLKMGKLQQAEEVFDKAIAKGSPYYMADYYYSQGELYETKTEMNKAIESYQKSLKENPYHIEASKKLQDVLISTGKKQEAEKSGTDMKNHLKQIKTIYAL